MSSEYRHASHIRPIEQPPIYPDGQPAHGFQRAHQTSPQNGTVYMSRGASVNSPNTRLSQRGPAVAGELTAEDSRAVGLGARLSGVHLSRKIMAASHARQLAGKHEPRHEAGKHRAPEQDRGHRLLRAAALLGAAAIGIYAAHRFDMPPLAAASSMGVNRLGRSPSVAETGAPITPAQSHKLTERLQGVVARRRARKASQ